MPQAIVSGMAQVPLSALSEQQLNEYRAKLTFKVSDGAQFGGGVSQEILIPCFHENESSIFLPRYFFEQEVKSGFRTVKDGTVNGQAIGVQFRGKLISEPNRDQPAASRALASNPGGIVSLRTAFGKTVVAIHAAVNRGRRTLIVVPTSPLLAQWIERIVEFTDLKREDIGIVQGPICQWNKPFIVGLIHSLYKHERPPIFYNSVGTVIFDECHTMPAPAFIQAVPKFPARYRWGLSATVRRKDGLHKAFGYHIGPVVYECLEQNLRATVYVFHTHVALDPRQYQNVWNHKTNLAKMMNVLSGHEKRNGLIADQLAKAAKAGRKILAPSRRTQQLITLQKMLIDRGIKPQMTGLIVGEGKITPEVMAKRLKILAERQAIFANEGITGKGVDQPDLNCLCLGLPSQDIEQLAGRITREHDGKEDFSPIVMDFVDSISDMQRAFQRRLKIYNRLGFRVKYTN